MDTDAHGSDMSLTEGVIGSAFEVQALRPIHAIHAAFPPDCTGPGIEWVW